jgi:hypothetical protein
MESQQQQNQHQQPPSFKMECRQHTNVVMQPRRSDLSPCDLTSITYTNNKRKATKRTSNISRRWSSLCDGETPSRRGHSDIALMSSSGTSGLSHLARSSNTKRLRRSISWDVRPPTVHVLKPCTAKSTSLNIKDDDERMEAEDGGGKNKSWYSVRSKRGVFRVFPG